jgi:hypothetical protein
MEHHVGFAIKDLDKIVHFYRDILGFIILDVGIREGAEAAAPMGMSYVKYRIFRAIPPKATLKNKPYKFIDKKLFFHREIPTVTIGSIR